MIATTLPADAANLLVEAAATPITEKDPWARVKAIETAEVEIRKRYPQKFKDSDSDQVDL